MPSPTVCNRKDMAHIRFSSGIGICCILFCAGFFSLVGALPAFAHKVSIFAYAENGTVYTESYFPDGKPVVNGKIEVYNSAGRLIQDGRTDEEGNFKFKIQAVEDLIIVLDASMGHRAEYSLKSDELAGGKISGAQEEQKTVQGKDSTKTVEKVEQEKNPRPASDNPTAEDIRKIVREELSRQIEPVRRGIIDLEKKEKVSIRDVFSGIGYILGLMGMALFVYNLRQKKSSER